MSALANIQESYRDAQQMERCSILADDDNTQESDMTTVTIEGHIYAKQEDYEDAPRFEFASYDVRQYRPAAQVCPYTISVEIPDDFDMRPGVIESLKTEKARILAEAQVKVTAIDERISKLLAITHKEEQ